MAGTSLPLDGPILECDAPLEIGRSLWGPFHRLCLQAEAAGRSHIIRSGPFTTTPLPGGDLRIATTLHVPTETGALRAELSLRRAASGEVLETALAAPPGSDAEAAAALAAMQAGLVQPAGGFLCRQALRTGEMVALATAGAGAMPLLGRVLGRSHHLGRAVLVLRCAGTQAVSEPGWDGMLVAEGHVAVDIATGMVILSALTCRLAGAEAPLAEIRLQAWVTLRQDVAAAA